MDHQRGHVLILPYPSQGHISPLLQFGKRLAHHHLHVTFAVTRYILATPSTDPKPGPLTISPISDGFDDGGYAPTGSIPAYLGRLELPAALIESNRAEGRPVNILVYDAFLLWALDVGKRLGVTCESCTVGAIYCHARAGRLSWPAETAVELPGLPRLEPQDPPSYLTEPVPGPYLTYFELVLNQFSNLDTADVVPFNTFYELESREVDWLKTISPITTIGPTVPSAYLDNQIPSDKGYSFNLYTLDTGPYMTWPDS